MNLQNYCIIYPAQTGTIHQIQGSVSIDQKAWTGEKTYGDDSFPLTGVKIVGDGVLNYTSSDEKVLTVDAQGQVTIKGTGSAKVSITMAEGTNYRGTSTPAEGTITIEKGTPTLTLTAVNRTTGVQLSKGILEQRKKILISLPECRAFTRTSCRVMFISMIMKIRMQI